MSDIFTQTPDIALAKRPRCRVAYTLNNTQPVACTIIGDQPLFYMDFQDGVDDGDFLSEMAEIGLLEREINQLKNEIDSYSKFSSAASGALEKRVEHFLSDAALMTKGDKGEDRAALMNALVEMLSQSRLARAYLEAAEKHGVRLEFSAQVEKSFYDRRAEVIFLNPNTDLVDLVLLSVAELRRHWQRRQGALINPLAFHPDNAVLINRAQSADLAVSMVRVAWEVQLSGNRSLWERIEASTMADLGRAFAREAFLDFRTINNGQAASAAFETWFLSERCRQHDKALIQQMLSDSRGYVFDIDKAMSAVTPNLLGALGEMPFGKNYLASHATTILADPVFTEVRDRSNANFLWFIKFERSFKETESELKAEEPKKEIVPLAGSAEIVTLANNNAVASRRASRLKSGSSAQIVYLRRWNGEA